MLVRASTLKMIRLQLAMERRDRRVALEEVDDLLALDRRLQDYLGDVERSPFFRELEVERAALNREKLTLAAEVIRREEPPPAPEPRAEDSAAVVEAPDTETWGSFEFVQEQRERRNRGMRWLALILLILSAIAAVAYWLADAGTPAGLAASLLASLGAAR